MEHLKAYVSQQPSIGPIPPLQLPDSDIIDDQEEYEVEEILSHRKTGSKTEYLVCFKGYGPEDDLWLLQRNLSNAPEILPAYHNRQLDGINHHPVAPHRARLRLIHLGHLWLSRA